MYCVALNCKVALHTVSFMLRKYAAIDQEGSVSQCNQHSELGQLRSSKVWKKRLWQSPAVYDQAQHQAPPISQGDTHSLPVVQKIPDQILFNIVSHLLHPWQCGIIICNVPRKLIATIIQSSINKRWLWWQCHKRKHCWQFIFEIVRSLDDKKCDWWWYEWSQIMYSLNPLWFSFKVWTSWNSIHSIDLY